MSIDLESTVKVLSLIATIVGLWLTHSRRERLIAFVVHSGAVVLPSMRVFNHAYIVRNDGRAAAKNVRIAHEELPAFSLYPPLPHTVDKYDGGADIVLPVLVPRQWVIVNYIYQPPVTVNHINRGVRSDEGLAMVVDAVPTLVPPWWQRWLAIFLMWVGGSVVVYYPMLWIVKRIFAE